MIAISLILLMGAPVEVTGARRNTTQYFVRDLELRCTVPGPEEDSQIGLQLNGRLFSKDVDTIRSRKIGQNEIIIKSYGGSVVSYDEKLPIDTREYIINMSFTFEMNGEDYAADLDFNHRGIDVGSYAFAELPKVGSPLLTVYRAKDVAETPWGAMPKKGAKSVLERPCTPGLETPIPVSVQ